MKRKVVRVLNRKSYSTALRVVTLAAIVVLTSGFLSAWSSSEPELWEGWEAHNPANTNPLDHTTWAQILKKYVRSDTSGLTRFSYGKVTSGDRMALKSYIAQLSKIKITDRARNVQLAYWINLYNALTVEVILAHYPVKSIRDIDISGTFSDGPWGKELVTVEGAKISLDNIEHEILRPIWKDPRVHYAVNCASIGCPNLADTAYTAGNIQSQLDTAAKSYINHPRGVSIENGQISVSKIYKWFAYDFGNSERGIINHLAKYATPKRAAQINKIGRISNTKYDWSLNE